jgi:hypothetical protein
MLGTEPIEPLLRILHPFDLGVEHGTGIDPLLFDKLDPPIDGGRSGNPWQDDQPDHGDRDGPSGQSSPTLGRGPSRWSIGAISRILATVA